MNKPVGIDLGTTNSSVAVLNGATVRVFKDDRLGVEHIPSAVYQTKDGALVVGHEAKERVFSDPENSVMEFKRNMGADHPFTFGRSGRTVQPEDLSAEVLKYLSSNVVRSGGKPVTTAVITVPADFGSDQNAATMRAANLAGIKNCLLLTEPVAAAQAYSFDSAPDKTFWLVYDLGGGTFDAAIIQVRDGRTRVVDHKGDNLLGGKDIDLAIVNDLLVPALPSPFTDSDREGVRSQQAKWRGTWSKLKIEAEKAKIALSNSNVDSVEIQIDFLCKHPKGEVVEFNYCLKREDLERLATPVFVKTVNIVKELLASARLKPSDIGKLILVGGPTLMPLGRRIIAEIGVSLEFGVDPMTVVAQGAAIFAAGQFVDVVADDVVLTEGTYALKLDYHPVTPDLDPEVGGSFISFGDQSADLNGFTVEFTNETMQPKWRSSKLGLNPKGAFLTTLEAQRGLNLFTIELCDARGVPQRVEPQSFEIVAGKGAGVFEEVVHNHSIGVALASNEVLVYYDKGMALPVKKRKDLRTTVSVAKGSTADFIRVPIVEGEKVRANRNRQIGELIIGGTNVIRDVPAGTPIEVTVEVDKSGIIRASAFIPDIDLEVEEAISLKSYSPDQAHLKDEADAAKARLAKLRDEAEKSGDGTALRLLQRIDEERMVHEIDHAISMAANDAGAGRQCLSVLNRLNSSLDDIEDALEWPQLTTESAAVVEKVRDVVHNDEYASEADRRTFSLIEREVNNALAEHSPDVLRRALAAMEALKSDVYRRDPAAWVGAFERVKTRRSEMTNQSQADRLINDGDKAMHHNDLSALQQAVMGLWQLLPDDEQANESGVKSTVMI